MKNIFKKKKNVVILAILFTIIFVIVFSIFITNNKTNKLSGNVIIPVNSSFTDNEFYSCVVNAYNEENNTNYGYDYNLSDEQLASIKKVDCNNANTYLYKGDIFEDGAKYVNNGTLIYPDSETKVETWLGIPNSYLDNFINISMVDNLYTKSSYDIGNIDGVGKLTGLKELYLDEAHVIIKDEFIFKNNVNLETLKINLEHASMGGKAINLSSNINLKTLYYYSDIGITDYPEQFKKRNLNEDITLFLYGDSYGDITNANIKNLQGVSRLGIINCNKKNYSYVKELVNLKNLIITTPYDYDYNNDFVPISDFASISNLETLYYQGKMDYLSSTGTLPKMEKLKKLYLNVDGDLDNFNFENVSNVEYLSLKDDYCEDKDKRIMELNGFSSLNKLKYLNIENFCLNNLTGIEVLTNLETLVGSDLKLNNKVGSIKNFKGSVNNYANLPNLRSWYTYGYLNESPKRTFSEEEIKIIKNLNYIVCPYFNYIISNIEEGEFNNLEYLYVNGISQENLNKLVNLKELEVFDTNVLNIENNKKLQKVYGYNFTGFSDLVDLEIFVGAILSDEKGVNKFKANIPQENLSYYEENYFSKIVPSNTKKLTKLKFFANQYGNMFTNFNIISNLDFSNNLNLEYLRIVNAYPGNDAKMDVSKCSNLRYLYHEGNLESLDISNNKKLAFINTIIPNKKIISNNRIDLRALYNLPEQIKFSNFLSESAALDGDIMIINNPGHTDFKVDFTNTSAYNSVSWNSDSNITISENLLFLNVSSVEMDVNNDKMYIFTNGVNKEKNIIRGTNLSSYVLENEEEFSKIYMYVDKNNLVIANKGSEVLKYELVKVLSSKYEVKDSEIRYLGDFDISNVRIINANYEIEDNVLKIIKGENLVKEYKLVQEDAMLGDVNNDGKISISDLTKQYKHVKYTFDLEGKDFYRADINTDDDVTITDVSLLYKILKENAGD